MHVPLPPSLEHLNPRDAWAMSLEIRIRLTGIWGRLGLDPLAPFGGLEAAPQFLGIGSVMAMRRTLTGLVVRSWGARCLRGIPVPAQWRALRSDYVVLTREEIDRAADRLHACVAAWRAGRYLPPSADAALAHGRRLMELQVHRFGAERLAGEDGLGPTVDRALGDVSTLARHLGISAGVPATHPDFVLHRRLLVNAAWVGAHRAADDARAEFRVQRRAAVRGSAPQETLAAELFG